MPILSKVQHYYALECYYYWGGEIKIPLLIQTNINMADLMQTDLPQYINFVDTKLAHLFDFANYSSNPTLCRIGDYELDEDATDIEEAIKQLSDHDLANIRNNNSISLEVNKNQPSSFESFTEINEELFNLMKSFTQFHTVIV